MTKLAASRKPATSRQDFFRVRAAIVKRAKASVSIDGHRIVANDDNATLIEIVREAEAQLAYEEAVQSRLAA
jgi:hypothetical protein